MIEIGRPGMKTTQRGRLRTESPRYVISDWPIHGGNIHGAKASLKVVRHQVNYHNTRKWPTLPVMPSVAFTAEDAKGIIYPHYEPLVVSLQISTVMLHDILVDEVSFANILFMPTFEKMGLGRSCFKPFSYLVIRFTWATIVPEGTIKLPLKLGEGSQSRDLMVKFLIVDDRQSTTPS